ncbi:hypothetical protein C8F04DRAFT_1238761 [Mycena alexandri]|uniref:Glucose-methanol-choline oxidoreductase C-terminal domain-containing protein n=1 Tax=Mycena alexandri TaxID=1745969 RepID=A0AAD6WT17_9AGAR|nr:hypothetical protein C8F04DRAFT_1238761 [Mycena alexandri]
MASYPLFTSGRHLEGKMCWRKQASLSSPKFLVLGENYQDHALLYAPYIADPQINIMNPFWRGDPATTSISYPLRHFWTTWRPEAVFTFQPRTPLRPPTLSLGSSRSTTLDIVCDFSYYVYNPADVAALRWAYEKGRELNRRLPSFRGVFFPGHPSATPKIVISAENDEAIDAFLRQVVVTTWHSVRTWAMKPFDIGGVVDSNGVKKLKVVDLFIAPSNVNSNTYSAGLHKVARILPFLFLYSWIPSSK